MGTENDSHHAPGAIADFTLCGFAYEGECGSPKGGVMPDPPPIVARPGRPITCGQCLQIIEHCRSNFQSEKIRGMYRRATAKESVMSKADDEIERERRAARGGCDDLDPNWPTSGGLPRGPMLCVLYPRCECGKKDRLAQLRNKNRSL